MVKSQSPLLNHLITAEKNAQSAFNSYTVACEAANNALNGWAAADTGDSPDVMTVSNRVCELFDNAFEAQKTYLIGLANYRSSLKDVAAREAEIRVIMRDRDIFVSRLVKLNNKKLPNSDSAYEAHTAKLEEARAELAACESTLKSEERALVGVKRRIFREALRMRMRSMGQMADTWRDTADRAVQILDNLDSDNGASELRNQQAQPPPPTQMAPATPSHQRHSRLLESFTSPEGSVIAPSHSASQVARRKAGYPDDFSDDEDAPSVPGGGGHEGTGGTLLQHGRSSTQQDSIAEEEEEGGSSADERNKGTENYQVHVNKPLTPAELAARKQQNGQTLQAPAPVASQPSQPPVTSNAALPNGTAGQQARKRLSSAPPAAAPQQQQAQPQGILRATSPTPVRETPEERMKRISSIAPGGNEPLPSLSIPSSSQYTIDAYKKKNAPEATMTLPSSSAATKSYHLTSDTDDEEQDQLKELGSGSGGRRRTVSGPASSTHRRTNSFDTASIASSNNDASTARGGRKLHTSRLPSGRQSGYYGGGRGSEYGDASTIGGEQRTPASRKSKHEKEKSGGFFGAVAGLFKSRDLSQNKKDRGREDDTPPSSPRKTASRAGGDRDGWSTVGREESGLKKSSGGSIFGGSKKSKRVSTVQGNDSDSDAPDPRSLVRVVNNGRPMSDIGSFSRRRDSDYLPKGVPVQTYNPPPTALKRSGTTAGIAKDAVWVPPNERPARKAMSDLGGTKPKPATAVKRKSTIKSASGTLTPTTDALTRKSSVKSTATAASVGPDGVVKPKKKKVRPASTIDGVAPSSTPVMGGTGPAGPGPRPLAGKNISYDASGWVSTAAKQAGVTIEPLYARPAPAAPTPAQRVSRDTPSLMSVVAPHPHSRSGDMHLPSAKNPGMSASSTMPALSNDNSRPASPALGADGEPVKRKKTVKKASGSGATTPTGLAPPSALKQSATSPSLAVPSAIRRSSSTSPARPPSILSNGGGSEVGSGMTPGRRKSVRLASDTNIREANYTNLGGGPATLPQQQPAAASTSSGAVPNGMVSGGGESQAEWGTRIGRDGDISSDEEGDEYAKIRAQLNRADRDWQSAGLLNKGKGRAV